MARWRLTPFQRRWRRFYERLAVRRSTTLYEPRDPYGWFWEREMRALGDDNPT